MKNEKTVLVRKGCNELKCCCAHENFGSETENVKCEMCCTTTQTLGDKKECRCLCDWHNFY